MRLITRFCAVTFLTLVFLCLKAQDIQVRYLGIENGLSNNVVNTIFQDHNGFMWFGTYDGLNRYDGYRFITYRNIIDDSSSLSSNNINAIDEDATHRLWVGGQKGLNIFNPVTSTFSTPTYSLYKKATAHGLNDNVMAIKVMKGTQVLAGTQHNGLFYFSGDRIGRQIPLLVNGKQKVDYYVSAIDYDKKKNIAYIFIANYGLYEFDFRSASLRLKSDVIHNAYCLKVTTDNRIWLGNDQGLFYFDTNSNSFSNSANFFKRPVVNLCEDKKGNLWIASDGAGVWLLQQGESEAAPLQPNGADGKSLINSNSVYAIYEDKEERKWIGTLRGGINLIEPATPFRKVVYQPGDNNASVKNFIFSFCEDASEKVWIGTDGAGLRLWDRSNNTYQNFEYDEKNPSSISSNFITSIIKDAHNDIWLSTWFGGISRYNRATKSFKRYACYNNRTKGYNSNVWRLLADTKQRLWACAVRGGALYKFNFQSGQFEDFDNSLLELQEIVEDRRGNIWAGDYSTLIKIDTVHKKHKFYPIGYPVRCIYEDKKNNFWVGTQEGGLLLFDRKTGSYKRHTTREGLANNTVLRILEDEKGNLWISTYGGLSKFDPSKNEWQNFYQSDGLQSNQFSFNAAAALSNGELLFGGIKGFNVFHPASTTNDGSLPKIYLSSLRINNRRIEENESFVEERNFEIISKITVPYDKALLTLEYLGLDYADAPNIGYAYRLKGWDKHWNYVNNTRTANYSRLQEGTYVFEVKASNKNGNWGEPQQLLSITVLPPWYRTWWAYCSYFLVLSGLLYLYTLYKNRQTQLQYQIQIANLEVQKEKELNEKKIAFFTNVSHEFRTPLSLIINPIKELLHKTENRKETAELRIVYRNAKRLLRLVDQLLLFKKAEQDLDKLNLTKLNLHSLCRDVFLCFVEQARSRKIIYEFQCDVKNINVEVDKEKIEIALFNLISNAFKFTPDGGTIVLKIEEGDEEVAVSISDTGPGVPEEAGSRLFERFVQLKSTHTKGGFGIGLYLVKTFIEAHGGSVRFENREGAGTVFNICLSRNKETENMQSPHGDVLSHTQILEHETPVTEQEAQTFLQKEQVLSSVSSIVNEMTEEVIDPEEETNSPAIIRELATEKQTLLIVDDDNEIRHYLISIFNDTYKIHHTDNGADGIRLAKTHLPDLIISDIVMQGVDGLNLCRTLKGDSALNHIPIVLLTGTSSDEMQLESMNSGADDYIKKPFDNGILLARVSAILKRRNTLQSYFYNEVTLGAAKFKISAEYREFIEKCMKVIEEHLLDDDFSIKVLAAEIGMGHSNLYKKIRAVSGQSVNSFIRFVRLKKAAEIFISSEMNVNETANMIGFNDMKYFRNQFANQFGLNPSDYIKKYRKPFHNSQTLDENLRK